MGKTTVRTIMTTNVESLRVGETLDLARDIMSLGRIRHLPVVDGDGHLVGLVTHRKILGAWLGHGRPTSENPHAIDREVPVEMIMDKDVATVTPDVPASQAAQIMETYKYGCLPVVEWPEGGKLLGIVTEADFVHLARIYLEEHDK